VVVVGDRSYRVRQRQKGRHFKDGLESEVIRRCRGSFSSCFSCSCSCSSWCLNTLCAGEDRVVWE